MQPGHFLVVVALAAHTVTAPPARAATGAEPLARPSGHVLRLPTAMRPVDVTPVVTAPVPGDPPSRRLPSDINHRDRPTADTLVAVAVEFGSPEACRSYASDGTYPVHRFDRFAEVLLRPDPALAEALAERPDVTRIEFLQSIILPPVKVPGKAPATRSEPERIVRGGTDALTGKGVVLALIDSGLDFRHEDFVRRKPDGTLESRVLYLWDTTSDAYATAGIGAPGPFTYPNGTPIGTVFDRAALTQLLRAEGRLPALGDPIGHGTSCASIAAGVPALAHGETRALGVAPDADLVMVRIAGSRRSGFSNGWLIAAACDWLDGIAGPRPLVVSMSLGSLSAEHDGSSLIERQLDQRFLPGRVGRAMVVSAGNDGDARVHARIDAVKPDEPAYLSWQDPEADGFRIDLFLDPLDLDDLVADPAVFPNGQETELQPLTKDVNPFNHRVHLVLAGEGAGGIFLHTRSGQPLRGDAYLRDAEFKSPTVDPDRVICSPACARNLITIGSYDWNNQFEFPAGVRTIVGPCADVSPVEIGRLSCYSSRGFVDGEFVKPDLVAPGQFYYASRASADGSDASETTDRSGRYRPFNGTSAATPYVAGIVALMLQRRPELTTGQIRERLHGCLSHDEFTGTLPNSSWGHGKLDFAAVERLLAGLRK